MSNRLAALEQELREEAAASLGRVAARLEAEIAAVSRLAAEHAAAAPDARPALAEAHVAARARAELYLWYLQVQREALGLRDHTRLFATFVIPPRLPR